jgi:hypothetical protein
MQIRIRIPAGEVRPGVLETRRARNRHVQHKRLVQLGLVQQVPALGVIENAVAGTDARLGVRPERQPG